MKTLIQKFDNRSLKYGNIEIRERVLFRQGKEPSEFEPLKFYCNRSFSVSCELCQPNDKAKFYSTASKQLPLSHK